MARWYYSKVPNTGLGVPPPEAGTAREASKPWRIRSFFFFFFFLDVIFKDIARSFGGRVSGVTVEPVNVGVVDIFFLRPGALPLKHSFGR